MTDYLAHLRADADAVLAVLATADLSEPVEACPGWTLRDLVEHLGNVHRWAAQIVLSDDPRREEDVDIENVADWFATGAEELLAALAAADPGAPGWSFTADRTKGFWRRRQALETVVHRWDAERAVGEPNPIDAGLAADGVSEVVDLMTPRQIKLGRMPALPATVELRATDAPGAWLLGDGAPTAHVSAAAETLLLLLWHRVSVGDPRVRIDGDADAAHAVITLALAP